MAAKRKTSRQIAASRRNIKKAQIASARKRRRFGVTKKRVAAVAAIGAMAYTAHRMNGRRGRVVASNRGNHARTSQRATSYSNAPRRPSAPSAPKAPPGYSAKKLFDELDKADAWLESQRRGKGKGSYFPAGVHEAHYQRTQRIWKLHG